MKKLPLAITTFADIRDKSENYLYVDKTEIAYQLADRGRYYFLSRPRRFGKSLFVDTLSDLFQAKKDLFQGLWVYEHWDWDTTYPVIKISFNSGNFHNREGIIDCLMDNLKQNRNKWQVDCENKINYISCFKEFIENIYTHYQQKVVILIDEYDKPILDNISINHAEQALIARNMLKSFYSVIKDNDAYIKFVFITGVSKFSKMNLFSGLNNLTDITTMPDYATICGYTHHDIETTFGDHLKDVDLERLKTWYNGYSYLGGQGTEVYNPYDILLFITNRYEYKNYWWGTGTPSFLIDKLKEQNYYIPSLENMVVSEELLDTFDIERINLVALLWQTGYLTFAKKINRRNKILYQLKVPNEEVQSSLNELFLLYLTNQTLEYISHQDAVYDALTGDIGDFKLSLQSLFASIPYTHYANNIIARYEGYYASVVFTYIMSLGFPCIAEDVSNKGRVDLTIKFPGRIVIIEFKVDMLEKALAQIKDKKYYDKYLSEAKQNNQEVFIVGVCFDSKDKNISEFDWAQI